MDAVNRNRKLVSGGNMRIRKARSRVSVSLLALGLIGVLSLMHSAPARAQVVGATVSGTVTDTSGEVIPNCQLSITNVATGVVTNVTTDAAGFYSAPNLIPGTYKMTASAPSFATQVRNGITLEVGAQVVQNVTLKVGQATQTVEVSAAPPDVQLSSPTIQSVVGSEAIADLPLNGRSWTDLAALQAGVATLSTQNSMDSNPAARATKGYGTQYAVGGARPTQNNFRLDGISVLDYSNGSPANVVGQSSGVDSIDEFSVLTTNYTAEYGLTSGGVINAVTRTGTDRFRGTAYEFIRNSWADARNYFDAATIPTFRRNQFGGSVGGPIRKGRAFFFGNYEGLRQSKGVTNVNIVPSAASRTGTLCSQPALVASGTSCTTSTITVDPSATAVLPLLSPPNAGLLPTGHGDTGYYDFVGQQIGSDNYFTTRLDDRISEKDSIAGTYMIGRSPFSVPDNFGVLLLGYFTNRQVISLEESHSFSPTLVNTARLGAFRQVDAANSSVTVLNPLANQTSLGSQPGGQVARLSISGISAFNGGANQQGIQKRSPTNYQFYDDAFMVRGRHSIKLGFAFERQDYNFDQAAIGGTWTFGSLQSFLTNQASSYKAQAINVVSTGRGIRASVFAGYVQDDWSWRPYLTFNLGLRYEMMTNPTEVNGYMSSLPTPTSATNTEANPFFTSNPTRNDWEPRVGFAWDPFHNSKTSVRGGFGFFDSMPLPYEWPHNMANFAPYAIAESATNASQLVGKYYNGVNSLLSPVTQSSIYIQRNPSRTYVMQRNLSIQRQVFSNLTATVTYVGSNGKHLLFGTGDQNMVIPTASSAGWLWPAPIGSGSVVNSNWGEIQGTYWTSASSYNALQAEVVQRMSHGLQFQSNFTWGKSLDNSSSTTSTNDFTNSIRNPLFYSQPLSRNLSDFNVARAFTANLIWTVPSMKSLAGVLGKAANGWQFGSIFQASDGEPFTPTWGTGNNVAGFKNGSPSVQSQYPDRLKTGAGCGTAINPQNAANYVNLNCFTLPTAPTQTFWNSYCDQTSKVYGSSKTVEPFPYCFNLLGNASRNSLSGPGLQELTGSLVKNTYVKENVNVQLRWEVFNVLNRANFAPPVWGSGTDLYNANGVANASAGVLTSTATSSRQMQLALKIIF